MAISIRLGRLKFAHLRRELRIAFERSHIMRGDVWRGMTLKSGFNHGLARMGFFLEVEALWKGGSRDSPEDVNEIRSRWTKGVHEEGSREKVGIHGTSSENLGCRHCSPMSPIVAFCPEGCESSFGCNSSSHSSFRV